MLVFFSARRLKPDAWPQFRRAWEPDDEEMPEGIVGIYHARNVKDPDEVISFGIFDGEPRRHRLGSRRRAGRAQAPGGDGRLHRERAAGGHLRGDRGDQALRLARIRSLPSAAVISTNQFKTGAHIEVDDSIYRIMDFQHVKPGKGGAFVRTKLRRIEDGSVIDKTFRAGEKFRPVRTETRKMQYLYDSGDVAVFMDSRDFEQLELGREIAGDAMRWVMPNGEVEILFVDQRPTGVQVASAVEMAVARTDPGLKGDTASGGGSKPATLESGVEVEVPLFVNEGDRIRVDTRTGEYVSRA